MAKFTNLRIAARAVVHVPPHRLAWHLRRRLHGYLVPLRSARYLAALQGRANALAPVAAARSAQAVRAADIVLTFFEAKHRKNVPQCFDGRFTFLNVTHDFGSAGAVDWRVEIDEGGYPLWRANLSFLGYLPVAAAHDPDRGLALAATLVRSLSAASKFERRRDFKDIWNSYPVAQRILALSALMIRLPDRLAETEDWRALDAFLRLNVAYLLANLEIELGFNHLERDLSALALYSLAAGGASPPIRRALMAHFDHVVDETIGDDGVQRERSAMYQALVVQSLSVMAELDIWSPAQRERLSTRLEAVKAALAALTLGDDMPMMMNDAWFEETPPTSIVLGATRRPGFTVLRDAGYVRLAAGEAVAIFDAGPIGPDANPGHGHPDFLAIELSLGDRRLIVDPGTSSYSADHRRRRDRSWDQHNGPAVAGGAPVEFVGSFKVGRRVGATLDDAGERDGVQFAAGSLAFGDAAMRRELSLDGERLTITDHWERGDGDRRSCFLMPGEWRVAREGDRTLVFSAGRHVARWHVREGGLEIGESSWTCFYNRSAPAHQVIVRPEAAGRAVIEIDWSGSAAA